MLDLAIVVVSFNTRDLLRACLTSLEPARSAFTSRGRSCQIIVVDNASSDDSARLVSEHFPDVRLIESPKNLGFAAANNLAIRSVASRYVALVNPDTEVRGKALEELFDFLETHPRAAVAGPSLIYPDGQFQHSAFRFPNLWMSLIDFFPINHRIVNSRLNGRYPRQAYERGEPFPIDHPLGAFFLVRRQAIDEVGPFDEGFFMYCEEIEWCLRMKRAGWQIYCCPTAMVVHHSGQSTRQIPDRMFVELHRSRFRLFRMHYPRPFATLARFAVSTGLLANAFGDARRRLTGKIERAEFRRRLSAYWQVAQL